MSATKLAPSTPRKHTTNCAACPRRLCGGRLPQNMIQPPQAGHAPSGVCHLADREQATGVIAVNNNSALVIQHSKQSQRFKQSASEALFPSRQSSWHAAAAAVSTALPASSRLSPVHTTSRSTVDDPRVPQTARVTTAATSAPIQARMNGSRQPGAPLRTAALFPDGTSMD